MIISRFFSVLLSLIGPGSNSHQHPENNPYDVNSSSSPSKNEEGESALPNSVSPVAAAEQNLPRLENIELWSWQYKIHTRIQFILETLFSEC